MSVRDRLMHAWNAFTNLDANPFGPINYGASYSFRPDRFRVGVANERSIVTSIYTRLAIDVSSVPIKHVRLDEAGRYSDDMISNLNDCLTLAANIDQEANAFFQDVAMTLFESGTAALVPVDTTIKPDNPGSYDILTMRVGRVVQWYPRHVKVSVYNDQTGRREEIVLGKEFVALVENPFYTVMNEPNSILQRLIRKLSLLDSIDEQSGSGKLDLIIQLPYVVKSEARRQQAEQRRTDIEFQLKGSKYGIAYTDGTEKITQLNRPVDNNLMGQIEYLVKMLYSQLGLTDEIMNGTASKDAMLNYNNRTIAPILNAIVVAMRRTFLTKTARTQGQSIMYFLDPFKLVSIADLSEMADKFTRNEVMSSNEIRQIVGLKPSKDPKADQLRNSNMPQSELGQAPTANVPPSAPSTPATPPSSTMAASSLAAMDQVVNETLDGFSRQIDQIAGGSG